MDAETQKLFDCALKVRSNSYSPYSGFKVGVSLLTDSGKLYSGCNIENIAFPSGQCAEASAIGGMVSQQGPATIATLMVLTDSQQGVCPCGQCLQKIKEHGYDQTKIIIANLDGVKQEFLLKDLLPGHLALESLD